MGYRTQNWITLIILVGCAPLFAGIAFHRLDSVPPALRQGTLDHSDWGMRSMEKLDFSDLELRPVAKNQFEVALPNSLNRLEANFPKLPMALRTLNLPENSRVEVLLSNVVMEESDGPVPVATVPKPMFGVSIRSFPLNPQRASFRVISSKCNRVGIARLSDFFRRSSIQSRESFWSCVRRMSG